MFTRQCLFVRQQDYAKRFQAIFILTCRIAGYCYGKNPLHFGIGPTKSGQLAAILDFCPNAGAT